MSVAVRAWRLELTYGIARVAIAGNFTLATAEVDAGVLLSVAPVLPVALRHVVDGHSAAGDDGVVLSRGEASKSRDGHDERGVEHGESLYGAESSNACGEQSQREINGDRRWRAGTWRRQAEGAQWVEHMRVGLI